MQATTGLRERVSEASGAHHGADGGNGGVGSDPGPGVTGRRDPRVLRWRKPLLAIVAALVTAAIQRAVYSAGKACPKAPTAVPAYLPIQTGALCPRDALVPRQAL